MTSSALPSDHRVSVVSLSSGRPLADRMGRQLGLAPVRVEERDFADGERKLRPVDSVRGRDVYLVESLHDDAALSVNDKLVRVLFLLAALRDAGASRLTCVAPYLCYARMDRRSKPRDPVTTRYVASLFEAVGIDRFVTVDVHDLAAFENSFRVPTEHLSAAPALIAALAPKLAGLEVVVVSPDGGGMKRAESFRRALERNLARPVSFALVEKFRSDEGVRSGAASGDIAGRVAILLDDLVSTGTTLVRAAEACREKGARAVYAAATHGVLAADAPRLLCDAPIERVFLLDTIPVRPDDASRLSGRLEVLDCAPLLARAIHRLHTNDSLPDADDG